ncbi:MAG: DUF3488 and transglutaminase-like domain-containing protein [Mycobacteriales bacterium]
MIRRTANNSVALTAAVAVFLSSTALSQVFLGRGFFLQIASAIAVAFGLGWLGRQLDVPAGLAPAVSFVGFVEYLTIGYFRNDAFLGVAPTPEVFRAAGRLIQEAAQDINSLAAPVVQTRALIFITVAGVFAVAVVVDLVALTLRRPVLAGLPLLTLFVIPSSLSSDGAGWLPFMLASAGYLALLTTEGRERVHRWGRRLTSRRLGPDDGYRAPILRAARGIGAAAIGFALIIPGLTPGLENGLLTGSGSGVGGGPGDGSQTSSRSLRISAVAELRNNLRQRGEQEVMRVWTDDPQYLRLIVLNEYTRDAWKVGPSKASAVKVISGKDIAPPPGLAPNTPTRIISSRIQVSRDLLGPWLPAPYAPAKVTGLKGTWRYDDTTRVISSNNKAVRNSNYTVESLLVTPDPHQLDDSLSYPADIAPYATLDTKLVDPSVIAQARAITAKASTDWGRAVALQQYFSTDGGFEYDVAVASGNGDDALVEFLQSKKGYCEQFAAAMAVMVRAIGLPSRVVIGFTSGTREGDYYSVTNHDAHAWPEVYFPGAGWVRFEPTPSVGGDAVIAPAVTSIVPTAEPSASPSASVGPDGRLLPGFPGGSREIDDFIRGSQRGGAPLPGDFREDSGRNLRPLLIGALLLLLLLIPVIPAGTRSLLRRRARRSATTPRQRSHVAWRHVHDDARDVGLSWSPSASPRVAARNLIAAAHLSGDAESAVRRLSVAEEHARYAPDAYLSGALPDFESDVAVLRSALLAAVPGKRRWRAVVFPTSTLRVISRDVHLATAASAGYVGRLVDRLPARLRMRPIS